MTINTSKPLQKIIRSMRKEIKSIRTTKNLSSDIPKSLSSNDSSITHQV